MSRGLAAAPRRLGGPASGSAGRPRARPGSPAVLPGARPRRRRTWRSPAGSWARTVAASAVSPRLTSRSASSSRSVASSGAASRAARYSCDGLLGVSRSDGRPRRCHATLRHLELYLGEAAANDGVVRMRRLRLAIETQGPLRVPQPGRCRRPADESREVLGAPGEHRGEAVGGLAAALPRAAARRPGPSPPRSDPGGASSALRYAASASRARPGQDVSPGASRAGEPRRPTPRFPRRLGRDVVLPRWHGRAGRRTAGRERDQPEGLRKLASHKVLPVPRGEGAPGSSASRVTSSPSTSWETTRPLP